MLPHALLFKRCDCPGVNDGNVLWLKGNEIATTDCNPCYYGLFVLVTGLCGGYVEDWPTDAIAISPGFYAIPNRGDEWNGDLSMGFSAIQPGTNALLRFYPVGVYRSLAQVQYVVTNWQSTLSAFRTGASTRLCRYRVTGSDTCPAGSGHWPATAGTDGDIAADYDVGDEMDLAIAGGATQGASAYQDAPGCNATFYGWVEFYLDDPNASADDVIVLVGDFDDLTEDVDDPETDSRRVALSQTGQHTWEWSGTVQCGPCRSFAIRAWCETTSHSPGHIALYYERRDCPDVSPAAEAAWQQVLDDMADIPTNSADLCDLQAAQAMAAEMGD